MIILKGFIQDNVKNLRKLWMQTSAIVGKCLFICANHNSYDVIFLLQSFICVLKIQSSSKVINKHGVCNRNHHLKPETVVGLSDSMFPSYIYCSKEGYWSKLWDVGVLGPHVGSVHWNTRNSDVWNGMYLWIPSALLFYNPINIELRTLETLALTHLHLKIMNHACEIIFPAHWKGTSTHTL